jgi:hypothetical protein
MDAKPSPTSLRLRLLGLPSIEQRGQPIALPAKAIALLAYLALTQPTSPRSRLIGLLWPESGDEAGRKNLRNLLWTIHKALGEEAIEVAGEQLGLRDSVWVDLRDFEAFVRAVVPETTTLPYMRPSGGAVNQTVIDASARLGYRPVLWSAATGDSSSSTTSDQMVQNALSGVNAGAILLTHFSQRTATALPQIIDGLRAKGLEPVSLTRLFAQAA